MKRKTHLPFIRAVAGCLCAALLCLPLGGCSIFSAADLPGTTTADEAEYDENLVVVGFCQTGAESLWRVANTESIQAEFTEENGYRLLFVNAQQKQENQIRAIRNFIQQQVDYIVFSPITETGWDSVLEEAKEAGIPVILTDREAKVADESLYTAYVGSDFVAEGKKATDWLRTFLTAEGRSEEPIHIVEIMGNAGSSPQVGRAQALDQAVAVTPTWTLDTLEGDFTTAKAQELMSDYLTANPAPDVLVCQNDDTSLGAIAALEQNGCYCGTREGQVLVLSFDATNAGLQACLAGKIAFNAECNPLQGPLVREIIDQLERGEAPSKRRFVPEAGYDFRTITQATIDARPY